MGLFARRWNDAVPDRTFSQRHRRRSCARRRHEGQGGNGVVGSNRSAKVPKGVLYELRQMYYDCAQTSNPIAMRALRTVVPVSQIVFGTDFRSAQQSKLQKVSIRAAFSTLEIRAINRENALKLLGRKP